MKILIFHVYNILNYLYYLETLDYYYLCLTIIITIRPFFFVLIVFHGRLLI